MKIVFDIGGTKLRVASSVDGGSFKDLKVYSTPKDFREGMDVFEEAVKELSGGKRIESVSGGIAGTLNKDRSELVNSPNLPGWTGKPLKGLMKDISGAPVFVENDAAIAGLGEAIKGAGRKEDIVVYITVSTGVGGVRIVGGEIDDNSFGFEPGQQILGPEGSLEDYVSGGAIKEKHKKEPNQITSKAVWNEAAKWLSVGLNNTLVHWSPDIVVMGGPMILKAPGISIDKVRYHLEDNFSVLSKPPRLEESDLGDSSGLFGALVYINKKI